jgi:NADH-quinone oxidoreductase subunit E
MRFSADNLRLAEEIVSRYPLKKSALIPLLHLAQEQDGWVTNEAMEHVAELCEVTPAEVIGTGSFYEMFKFHPVGRYVVNICTNISCQLSGGEELLHHAEHTLGVKAGGTTPDGLFTLEDVECIAACTEAPCFQVNYRYFNRTSPEAFDEVVGALRAGRDPLAAQGNSADPGPLPDHGTLARIRQTIPADRRGGVTPPEQASEPVWLARNQQGEASDG